jgi:hypothetical protein
MQGDYTSESRVVSVTSTTLRREIIGLDPSPTLNGSSNPCLLDQGVITSVLKGRGYTTTV